MYRLDLSDVTVKKFQLSFTAAAVQKLQFALFVGKFSKSKTLC